MNLLIISDRVEQGFLRLLCPTEFYIVDQECLPDLPHRPWHKQRRCLAFRAVDVTALLGLFQQSAYQRTLIACLDNNVFTASGVIQSNNLQHCMHECFWCPSYIIPFLMMLCP